MGKKEANHSFFIILYKRMLSETGGTSRLIHTNTQNSRSLVPLGMRGKRCPEEVDTRESVGPKRKSCKPQVFTPSVQGKQSSHCGICLPLKYLPREECKCYSFAAQWDKNKEEGERGGNRKTSTSLTITLL